MHTMCINGDVRSVDLRASCPFGWRLENGNLLNLFLKLEKPPFVHVTRNREANYLHILNNTRMHPEKVEIVLKLMFEL